MKIREVLENKGKRIISVDGDLSVSKAVEKMTADNIGALVIQGKNNPEGIFTERDVLRLWSDKERVKDMPVKDVMTKSLIITSVDDTLIEALALMIHKKIRHLLVIDGANVVGLLSIRDLAKEQVKNTEAKIRLLENVLASEIAKDL
jgi:CBS domain-containing protein